MGVDQQRCDFLRRRMVALREKNHKNQSEMARLIDELSKVYSRVIVPNIVINELDHIKDRKTSGTEDVVHAPLRSDYMAERVTSL